MNAASCTRPASLYPNILLFCIYLTFASQLAHGGPWRDSASDSQQAEQSQVGQSQVEATPRKQEAPAMSGTNWRDKVIESLRKTGVTNYSFYNDGVWAKYQEATYYIGSLEKIPDWTRQYWMIVKILSEKYGCFMTAKTHIGSRVTFRCRDKRAVVFQVFYKKKFVYFRGHQYDTWGNLLHVKNHEIIERTPIEDQWFN